MIRVFIGFDPRETAAFHVLSHSLHARSSEPLSITPLCLPQLRKIHQRERHPLQSTDFSFSRFLVPCLSGYEGWSIFMDCDMLALDDITKLWSLRDDRYAVMCVKHEHAPREEVKFLGEVQTKYQKKNWSSMMLFNNPRCRALTPEYVDAATGLDLHQFKWLGDDSLIGQLPHRWNHLVGFDGQEADVAIVHHTLGGPYFDEYRDCEFAAEWFAERDRMLRVDQYKVRKA